MAPTEIAVVPCAVAVLPFAVPIQTYCFLIEVPLTRGQMVFPFNFTLSHLAVSDKLGLILNNDRPMVKYHKLFESILTKTLHQQTVC